LGHVSSRLALALFATTCALFAVIAVFAISRISAQTDSPPVVHTSDSPFRGGTLPPRVHAPEFTLTDQNAKRVSMAEYRGKPVVVTYTYTHCKETCPLQAQMIRGALDDVGHDIPALAISVDPFGDTRASARAFLAKQKMTGRMRYVLGTRRQLQPVWRGFAIQPQLRDSEHQAYITLVDRNGLQRVAVAINQTSPEDLAHDIRVLEKQ
ncbi:MAG TPA: SCO family protein, partial [Thermoleophilaceae bacterium]|nr:SCO family protein [Thermoleophilaceae bacterium]